jgi:hypothetical protein
MSREQVHKATGEIVYTDGHLSIEGEPFYRFPTKLTNAFIDEVLKQDPTSEFFLGRIMEDIVPSERRRFGTRCKEEGGSFWRRYAKLACSWASLLNADNQWHFEQLNVVYEQALSTPLVQTVYVTDTAFRLLATPRGILSFEEFRYRYGHSLQNYLLQWKAETTAAVDAVLVHGFSPLTKVRASVLDREGKATYATLVGPETLALEFWRVPQGFTLLTVE